jgi:hypothetical protein
MLTEIRSAPDEVDTALSALGLTRQPLLDAIKAGYLARSSCTANDAPFYPALSQWNRTVRVLREKLLVEGWSKSDDGNYCVVVNPGGSVAIAAASGCENTGNVLSSPTTKSAKGPSTVDAVLVNAMQLHLPGIVPPPTAQIENGRVTWLLLFHCDERELRAELSLPASMGDDGRPDAWKERIILPTTPLDPIVVDVAPDFGPDFDVDVKRRKSAA